jgi:hypothetical protein
MNKLLLAALMILATTACNRTVDISIREEVSIRGSTEAAQFIVECARAANPMSDEEGEDLVKECKWTAEEIYGVRTYYAWVRNFTTCKYSATYDEALKCAYTARSLKGDK